MAIEWKSFGASKEVSGSCHMVSVGTRKVLIDCGIFQGPGSAGRNREPFGFKPSELDAVIVTHGHLDHIGRLPQLVKRGFEGKIYSTRATLELAKLSFRDSVSIMRHEARRQGTEPLFGSEHVVQTLELWDGQLEYEQPLPILPEVEVTPYDAGHILGSAQLLLDCKDGDERRRIAISGDMGDPDRPLACDPAPGPSAEWAVVESTYGQRDHRSHEESVREFEEAICETFERGGNVLVPTFALQRAQELLWLLFQSWKSGRIPRKTQIFLDSPMATSATGIYRRHKHLLDKEARDAFGGDEDPFRFHALNYTRRPEESSAIRSVTSGAVILAGSGMVTGGRIKDHLIDHLERPESSVVFVGYQAEGTTGRDLIEGKSPVRIDGIRLRPEAKIHTIGGFSAHAGQTQLVRWVEQTGASRAYLVHGEEEPMEALQSALEERGVEALKA